MKKEIKSLTGIRGIAALYVAYYHYLEPFNKNLQYNLLNFIKHGYNAVDLFFILSGFVMSLSSKKLFDGGFNKQQYLLFMKRRFARVYPIYFVMTLLSFAFIYKFQEYMVLFINLLLLQILPAAKNIVVPAWSLSAEWVAYLCFPFLIFAVYKYSGSIWSILCLIFGFLLLFFVSQNNGNFMNGFQSLPPLNGSLDRSFGFSGLLRCFSEYIIGITIYKIFAQYKIRYSKYYHYASVPCSLLILFFLFKPDSDMILVFLFMVLIFSLSTDTGIIAAFLCSAPIYFLGEISYSLYIIHAFLVKTDANIYNHLLIYNLKYLRLVNNILFFITLIYFSFLSYRYIEIPSSYFLKKKLRI
jgi:peptidoglycan/LPS O-acetylase OafA/YrhL